MAAEASLSRLPLLCHTDTRNPTEVTDNPWIWAFAPPGMLPEQETYGKWLVFRGYDHLDAMWHTIRRQIESGELGCTTAKTSTMFCNPSSTGGGSQKSGVICVYTSRKDMDEVGFKLIQLVQNTIRYKTDEATRSGKYSCRGDVKTTCQTIYWNDGVPSFQKSATSSSSKPPPAAGTGRPMMHKVMSQSSALPPNPIPEEKCFGKWVIVVAFNRTTRVWQLIKQQIESGELHAIKAECPKSARGEKPAIHVFTSEGRVDEVGEHIVQHVVGTGTVISYEVIAPQQQCERHTLKTLQMSQHGDLVYGRPQRDERVRDREPHHDERVRAQEPYHDDRQQYRSRGRGGEGGRRGGNSAGEGPDTGDGRRRERTLKESERED